MSTVKTLAKGQVVIPAKLRKKYNIRPGSTLQIFEYGGMIHLVPAVADPVQAALGILPGKPSLSKKLLRDRAKDFR
jgi:AbrB family looped-hinge helix DNA binding protein